VEQDFSSADAARKASSPIPLMHKAGTGSSGHVLRAFVTTHAAPS